MSGIPPLPPLRIKGAGGSPNVIPVFQMTVSNITLTNQGGGKVLLDGAGGTGPSGPAGTLTIGSGITGGATDGFLLMVSNGATLGQVTSASFQRAIGFPVTTGSGGTGRITVGSAHTLLGVNSDGTTLSYYALLASDNTTIVKSGTGIFISANTGVAGSSTVYAATGNNYAVLNFAADLTAEYRLVQSGNSITIDTSGNLILINAVTGNLSTKQDSITYPLGINSGGTGLASVISATNLIGFSSSSTTQFDSYRLAASDNMTIIRSGTAYLFSATTGAGGGSGTINTGSANYLAYYPSSGTTIDDAPISVSTGAGLAPFNVQILTSAAASVASGDFWFQSSSNVMYLAVRSSSVTYLVAMAS